MTRKIHITFDNFTVFDDDTHRWMEPSEFASLPELHESHEELWQNYLRARAAHNAACLAIRHCLQFPDGSPQKEVSRMQTVFDELYGLYCDSTNFDRERGTGEQAADRYQETLARMATLLNKERER